MLILGINPGSHDSAACLVVDGVIKAAAEEERFTRRKHALGEMPWNATLYCLAQVGADLQDVDYIGTCWGGPDQPANSVRFYDERHVQKHAGYYREQLFPKSYFGKAQLPPMVHVSHHLAHAASAYRCSPFNDAAVLVVDGQGEDASTTIAYGQNGKIQFLAQFGISHSLGYFYQAVTDYLGLGWLGGEGKTMGLAAYGEARFDFPEFSLLDDGYSIETPQPDNENPTQSMLNFWRVYLEAKFGKRPTTRHLPQGLPHNMGFRAFTRTEYDIAASAQAQLELVLIHLAKLALRWTSSDNLVLSGGVALNCAANGRIERETGANVFIFPAAGDAGAAVGAALELSAEVGEQAQQAFNHPFLGPDFSDEDVEKIIRQSKASYSLCSSPALTAAKLIAEGHTVGWFQGRAELGPRALGHRSILADPRSTMMRDQVNSDVKHRELWRPFAPSILREAASELLGDDIDSPFMLKAVPISDSMKERVAGIVHVDGTVRPQTVKNSSDPLYHSLIKECYRLLGVPAILNTSFNDESEPIVCTPRDALRTYWSTGIDCLMIGNFLIGPKMTSIK